MTQWGAGTAVRTAGCVGHRWNWQLFWLCVERCNVRKVVLQEPEIQAVRSHAAWVKGVVSRGHCGGMTGSGDGVTKTNDHRDPHHSSLPSLPSRLLFQ